MPAERHSGSPASPAERVFHGGGEVSPVGPGERPSRGEPGAARHGRGLAGIAWPDGLVARSGCHHRVAVQDHRDTGCSTRAFDERPYALRDLVEDAVAVLDAFGVDRTHVLGMSMGGYLVQLLLLPTPIDCCPRR